MYEGNFLERQKEMCRVTKSCPVFIQLRRILRLSQILKGCKTAGKRAKFTRLKKSPIWAGIKITTATTTKDDKKETRITLRKGS